MKLLVNLSSDDIQTAGLLAKMLRDRNHTARQTARTMEMGQLIAAAKQLGAEAILCSNPGTLANIASTGQDSNLSDWRGARLNFSIPVLVISPTSHIITVNEGEFLMANDLDKLRYIHLPTFKYSYKLCLKEELIREATNECQKWDIIVFDIETSRQNTITSVAFTCMGRMGNIGPTFCIPTTSTYWPRASELTVALRAIKKILEHEGSIKAAHNGAFDAFHLIRHGIHVANYVWDTEYLWWCWYAELNKSLAFISSVLLPDYYYWKAEGELSPLDYNCKDTINTARCLRAILRDGTGMPAWAFKNYSRTYPLITPLLSCNFEGFLVNTARLNKIRPEAEAAIDEAKYNLRVMSATPALNPASPQQLHILFYRVLGAVKPARTKTKTWTDIVSLKKIALQHPLIARFVDEVLKFRHYSKAFTTYYNAHLIEGKDGSARALYNLQVDGTETGRLSSSKSSLWHPNGEDNWGLQAQNIPAYMRQVMIPDPGYKLGEADKSQSEARCTAYLANDELLREDLETEGRDFYCYMAFRFFNQTIKKGHPLRQLVKKIVHGTNYLMQEDTFIDSAGIKDLVEFQKVLGRPKGESLRQFAAYLLELYRATYSKVPLWWENTARQVKLSSLITTPDGWTRRIFGDPTKQPEVKRSLIAHMPQHLSVSVLNKAIVQAYYQLQVPSNREFRLKLQNHDSILFQAKVEKFDYYMQRVIELANEPTQFNDGRLMHIPVDAKAGMSWGEMEDWKPMKGSVKEPMKELTECVR